MNKKALFFDIDGTLLSEADGQIPQSALKALKLARGQGHLVFINTGRSFGELKELLPLIDVDGWLCGCGTYITAGGKVLYHRILPKARRLEICTAIERADMDGIMEGCDGCYYPSEESRFERGRTIRKNLAFALGSYNWKQLCGDVEKFCVIADEHSDSAGFFRGLGLDIQVIDRGDGFFECIPEGHSKATAIDVVLEHYQMKLSDAVVFGDSTNDISMFEHVPCAVLMGNHAVELEPYASFVTKTVEQDGIWYAMERLGLFGDQKQED